MLTYMNLVSAHFYIFIVSIIFRSKPLHEIFYSLRCDWVGGDEYRGTQSKFHQSFLLLQDILTSFSVLLELPTLSERIWTAFEIYSLGDKECSKGCCRWLLRILSSACHFCGDKSLQDSQISDLVDSIFTLDGKIDGNIAFSDLFTLLLHHPLLEMFTSIQFQGRIKSDFASAL